MFETSGTGNIPLSVHDRALAMESTVPIFRMSLYKLGRMLLLTNGLAFYLNSESRLTQMGDP